MVIVPTIGTHERLIRFRGQPDAFFFLPLLRSFEIERFETPHFPASLPYEDPLGDLEENPSAFTFLKPKAHFESFDFKASVSDRDDCCLACGVV